MVAAACTDVVAASSRLLNSESAFCVSAVPPPAAMATRRGRDFAAIRGVETTRRVGLGGGILARRNVRACAPYERYPDLTIVPD